jgi:hypothetical protein
MLFMVDVASAINAALHDKLNFNGINAIAPVASILRAVPRPGRGRARGARGSA